jgi:DNA-binding IclR family transcriptional regulator
VELFGCEGSVKPQSVKKRSATTLEKALQVLEVILEQPQSIGMPDLTDRLGMSRQSLHRVLQQMHQQGLIVKIPNRDRFAIGARLSKLAFDIIRSANQGIPILATIQKVVADMGESCTLGVVAGRDYVYIERVECEREPRIHIVTGIQLPAHITSGGKAMMAFLPDKVRAKTVQTLDLVAWTKNTIIDSDELLVELEEIRKRGYAIGDEEYSEGIMGVGVPVLAPDGFALASLAIHAPIHRVTLENAPQYAEKLQAAASRLAEIWYMKD